MTINHNRAGKTSRVDYGSTDAKVHVCFDAEALSNIEALRAYIDRLTGAKASTSLAVRLALRLAANRIAKEANG